MLNQYLMQETFRGAVSSVLEEDEAQAAYDAYELFQEDLDAIASEAAELRSVEVDQSTADSIALNNYRDRIVARYTKQSEG